ncbi:MAG: chemotaxis protein CheX [Bdellovibrionales bacterium]|nr:chemotaxis protein CheX [Bdellovibrionales bacterium]
MIDYKNVVSISREFYQSLLHLKSNLKKDQKHLHALNLSMELLKQIKADGIESAFHLIKSLDSLIAEEKSLAKKNNTLNVDFINPFLLATKKTLEVQCKTKVKILKPFLKKDQISNVAIASVLSLISNEFSGSIVLSFTKESFLKIYKNMFSEEHKELTAELEDAAAELLNIIYGLAKIDLNTKGFNFQKALPTILKGEKISIRQSGLEPVVIVPFETDAGPLHLEIEFNKPIMEEKHA